MLGMINEGKIATQIGDLFGGAAADLRGLSNEGRRSQESGDRPTHEPSLTDRLIHDMRNSIARRLTEISDRLRNEGILLEVEFSPRSLPVREEMRYGADLGLRMTIRTDEAVAVKGLLVQCKRMHRDASYPELRGRGERQAQEMLRITPASFFFLFNHGEQHELLDSTSIPISTVCPVNDERVSPGKRRSIGRNCPYWMRSGGGIWDLGVAVLPASRVLSLSARCGQRRTGIPTEARRVLPGCLPLGVFMIDFVGSCFVGDVREEVVRLVTSPGLRGEEPPPAAATRSEFEGFAVRHYLNIEITASGTEHTGVRR